ncbi:MAG: tRNA (adenosine(37)-N6)-threonylcarbamoyltransferase complex dimerization subunit type 1 TsaB [Hydrogenophilaceae bacterium]|nr:tRNA (adenosine(37)-N6)-threonylcarbamoyltransferase complex dimerization subunit type 1 TsaB [Hydrogenophilaceae bacterium]
MNILGIETSTEYCSLALWKEGEAVSRSELAGQRHSEILLPMIDALLKEQDCRLRDLDALAFGAGPGSFTGVRIAACVAQGLALGAGIPVLPVCTLEALAEASGQEKVAAALDARLDEVYFAAYERQGDRWHEIVSPCLSSVSDLPTLPGSGWTGVGTGFAVPDGALGRHLRLSGVHGDAVPQAEAIVALGARMLMAGAWRDPAEAQPIYLRDKVAMTTQERHARGFR